MLDETADAVDRLRAQMDVTVAARRRSDRVLDEIAGREATLKVLRLVNDLTQVEVAMATGMSQAEISRVEQRSDIVLSTLRRFVEATGGKLELVVRYPDVVAAGVFVDS